MSETYEQPRTRGKEKVKDYPDELYHRVKVERNPQTGRQMDVQIPRFRRAGFEEITAESDEDFVMMCVPRETYNKWQKDRQDQTTQSLMTPGPAGIDGESRNTVSVSRQNPETFFSGVEDDPSTDSGS